MGTGMRIILASASPRRRELLTQIGLDFEVMVSDLEEKVSSTLPHQVVEELSEQKAEAVLASLPESAEDILVIGADTVVALEGEILGKPHSREEAFRMLERLSGKTHAVYTGVTILYRPGRGGFRSGAEASTDGMCPTDESRRDGAFGEPSEELSEQPFDAPCPKAERRKTFYERTDVTFCPLTKEEIAFYVSTGDCMDKAGAYGIQGIFARYVKGIEGDYNNVVGLPAGRLYQEAKEWIL